MICDVRDAHDAALARDEKRAIGGETERAGLIERQMPQHLRFGFRILRAGQLDQREPSRKGRGQLGIAAAEGLKRHDGTEPAAGGRIHVRRLDDAHAEGAHEKRFAEVAVNHAVMVPVHLDVIFVLLVEVDLPPVGIVLERRGRDRRVVGPGPHIHRDTRADHRIENRETAHGRGCFPHKAGGGRVAVGNRRLRAARGLPAAAGLGLAFEQDQFRVARGVAITAVEHEAVVELLQMRRGESEHARAQALRGHGERGAFRTVTLEFNPEARIKAQVHVADLIQLAQRIVRGGFGIRPARAGVEQHRQGFAWPQREDFGVAAR